MKMRRDSEHRPVHEVAVEPAADWKLPAGQTAHRHTTCSTSADMPSMIAPVQVKLPDVNE